MRCCVDSVSPNRLQKKVKICDHDTREGKASDRLWDVGRMACGILRVLVDHVAEAQYTKRICLQTPDVIADLLSSTWQAGKQDLTHSRIVESCIQN